MLRVRAKRKSVRGRRSNNVNIDNEEEPKNLEPEEVLDTSPINPEEPKAKKTKLNSKNAKSVEVQHDDDPISVNGVSDIDGVNVNCVDNLKDHVTKKKPHEAISDNYCKGKPMIVNGTSSNTDVSCAAGLEDCVIENTLDKKVAFDVCNEKDVVFVNDASDANVANGPPATDLKKTINKDAVLKKVAECENFVFKDKLETSKNADKLVKSLNRDLLVNFKVSPDKVLQAETVEEEDNNSKSLLDKKHVSEDVKIYSLVNDVNKTVSNQAQSTLSNSVDETKLIPSSMETDILGRQVVEKVDDFENSKDDDHNNETGTGSVQDKVVKDQEVYSKEDVVLKDVLNIKVKNGFHDSGNNDIRSTCQQIQLELVDMLQKQPNEATIGNTQAEVDSGSSTADAVIQHISDDDASITISSTVSNELDDATIEGGSLEKESFLFKKKAENDDFPIPSNTVNNSNADILNRTSSHRTVKFKVIKDEFDQSLSPFFVRETVNEFEVVVDAAFQKDIDQDDTDPSNSDLSDQTVDSHFSAVESYDGEVIGVKEKEENTIDFTDEAPVLSRAYTPQPEGSFNTVDNDEDLPPGDLSYEGPVEPCELNYEIEFNPISDIELVEPSCESSLDLQLSVSVVSDSVPVVKKKDVGLSLGTNEVDSLVKYQFESTMRSLCCEANKHAFNYSNFVVFDNTITVVSNKPSSSKLDYYYCFSVQIVPNPEKKVSANELLQYPKIGNEAYPYLGNPKKGVYLSRRPDAVLPTGFIPGFTYRMHVYKVVSDVVETINVFPTTKNFLKSPNPNCNIRVSAEKTVTHTNSFDRFLQNLIYISEVDEYNEVVSRPSIIRPYGVVDFTVNEECIYLYKSPINFTKIGQAEINISNAFKMDIDYQNLGNRPLPDFAVCPFSAKTESLIDLLSKPVLSSAMTRIFGNFERDAQIHIRHEVGKVSDYLIKYTCFTSDDPDFPNLVKTLVDMRRGAFSISISASMPELKNNDQCCINFVLPNSNSLGLLGIPCLPMTVLHCLQVYKLPVGPTLCPLRTDKHESRLFNLAPSNLLVRSDRISDNDIRAASSSSLKRFVSSPENPDQTEDSETEFDGINAAMHLEEGVPVEAEPTTSQLSWKLPETVVNGKRKKKYKTCRSRRKLPPENTKIRFVNRRHVVQLLALRNNRGNMSKKQPKVVNFKPAQKLRSNRAIKVPIFRNVENSNDPADAISTRNSLRTVAKLQAKQSTNMAVLFEPSIFFNSQIPVEQLHEVLSLAFTNENSLVEGNFIIILHEYLHKAFENANFEANANMILYASCFSKYINSDKLVVQEHHYCDDNPPTFRTFLICAQATRQKRKLQNLVVLSENAATVDHAIYERNKIKILTPLQYIDAMIAGDDSILLP